MIPDKKNPLGAHYLGEEKCRFTLWASFHKEVALEIVSPQPLKVCDLGKRPSENGPLGRDRYHVKIY